MFRNEGGKGFARGRRDRRDSPSSSVGHERRALRRRPRRRARPRVVNYLDFDTQHDRQARRGRLPLEGPRRDVRSRGARRRSTTVSTAAAATARFEEIDGEGRLRAARSAGFGLGAMTLDYDHDGDTDLYVANDSTPNFLWENQGDGTFREVGFARGVSHDANGKEQASMGIACRRRERRRARRPASSRTSRARPTRSTRREGAGFRERSSTAGLGGAEPARSWVGARRSRTSISTATSTSSCSTATCIRRRIAPGTDTSYAQDDQLFVNRRRRAVSGRSRCPTRRRASRARPRRRPRRRRRRRHRRAGARRRGARARATDSTRFARRRRARTNRSQQRCTGSGAAERARQEHASDRRARPSSGRAAALVRSAHRRRVPGLRFPRRVHVGLWSRRRARRTSRALAERQADAARGRRRRPRAHRRGARAMIGAGDSAGSRVRLRGALLAAVFTLSPARPRHNPSRSRPPRPMRARARPPICARRPPRPCNAIHDNCRAPPRNAGSPGDPRIPWTRACRPSSSRRCAPMRHRITRPRWPSSTPCSIASPTSRRRCTRARCATSACVATGIAPCSWSASCAPRRRRSARRRCWGTATTRWATTAARARTTSVLAGPSEEPGGAARSRVERDAAGARRIARSNCWPRSWS